MCPFVVVHTVLDVPTAGASGEGVAFGFWRLFAEMQEEAAILWARKQRLLYLPAASWLCIVRKTAFDSDLS